jgi:hypothetical protein
MSTQDAAPGITPTTGHVPSSNQGELFGPGRRSITIGVVLLISMVAFEAMGVGTAMPALVTSLGALSLYAWAPCSGAAGVTSQARGCR